MSEDIEHTEEVEEGKQVEAQQDRELTAEEKQKRKKRKKLKRRLSESTDSSFADSALSVIEALDKEKNDGISKFYMTSLESLIELIPVAEENFRKRKTDSAAYALNALISQAREIIEDIQSEQDRGELVDKITRDVLNPAFYGMVQNLADNMYQLKKEINAYVPERHQEKVNDRVDEFTRDMAKNMQSSLDSIISRIGDDLGN